MVGARCGGSLISLGRRRVPDLRQFGRFFAVGAIGFAVDAGVVLALSQAGLNPLVARLLSFLVATLATYALNRRWTFGHSGGGWWRGWLTYVGATSLGAALNYAAFAIWIRAFGDEPAMIFAGTALGSAVGLVFNYTLSRRVVFRKDRLPDVRSAR